MIGSQDSRLRRNNDVPMVVRKNYPVKSLDFDGSVHTTKGNAKGTAV